MPDLLLAGFDRESETVPDDMTFRAQNSCDRGWEVWAASYGIGGKAQRGPNAGYLGYSFGGVELGMHRCFCEELILGFYGGYGRSFVDRSAPVASADVDHTSVGVVALRSDCWGYTFLDVAYVYDDCSMQRFTVNGNAAAKFHGHESAVYLERGVDLCWGGMRVQPMAALQYLFLNHDAFSETGAGALNMTVDDRNKHSLGGMLGVRTALASRCFGSWTVKPTARALWIHEFLKTQVTANVTSAPAMSLTSIDLGRDRAVLGVGVVLQRCQNRSVYLNYDVQVNGIQTFHSGSGGLMWAW